MTTSRDNLTWTAEPVLVEFIAEMEKHGNASMALEETGLGRGKLWYRRKVDPEFDAVFKEARKCGLGVLRDHGHKMSMGLLDEETFKLSDGSMLRFLVQQHDKSFNPSQRVELGGDGVRPFMFQMMLNDEGMKDEKNETP